MSAQDNGGRAFPTSDPNYETKYAGEGMHLRDYFAIHSVQPGFGEIASIAGLTYRMGAIWKDEQTRIDSVDSWFNALPLQERLELFARVKYAMADAMLKARQS